jgi:zinc D-Ala-D-Ala carboxypeptidase
MPKLSAHFTLEEFTMTQHRGIDNSLPSFMVPNALETIGMLERIRGFLSHIKNVELPIYITSGYRSKLLNDAVGSKDSSDHLRAHAVDWKCPDFGTTYDLCVALAPKVDDLQIGQLIHEFGSWVHCGVPIPKNRANRVITISRRGTEIGIQRV